MAPEQGLEKMKQGEKPIDIPSTTTITTTTTTNTPSFKLDPKPGGENNLQQRSPSPRTCKIKTTWVYSLIKAELEAYLREFGMDPFGTVEELRRRLATFINGGYYLPEVAARLSELETRHTPGGSTLTAPIPNGTEILVRSPTFVISTDASSTPGDVTNTPIRQYSIAGTNIQDRTYDRIRTWQLEFDGEADPIDFIERIEELARSQRIPLDEVPFTLSECLRKSALSWWRNRRHEWSGWDTFKRGFLKYFLPTNFWEDLDDAIRRRLQREEESFKDYALALETLMRHTQYNGMQKLERIYKNSLPAIRLLVKRREFQTLDEFTDLVSYIEATRGGSNQQTPFTTKEVFDNLSIKPKVGSRLMVAATPTRINHPVNTLTTAAPHKSDPGHQKKIPNPKEACRRCGQTGHFQTQCKQPPKLFCWECGKTNVRTKECCPRSDTRLNAIHNERYPEYFTSQPLEVSEPKCNERNISCIIKVGNREYPAIIDTGSWHSYVSEEVFRELPRNSYTTQKCNFTVVFADGSRNHADTSLAVTYHFRENHKPGKLLILTGALDPFILGMDFLRTAGVTLQFGTEPNPLGETTPLRLTQVKGDIWRELESQTQQHQLETQGEQHHIETQSKHQELDSQSDQHQFDPTSLQHEHHTASEQPHLESTLEQPLPYPTSLAHQKDNLAVSDQQHPDSTLSGPETTLTDVPEYVKAFLLTEVGKFAEIQGVARVGMHRLIMKDDIPIKQRYYPRNPAQQSIINEKVEELLQKDCIEPSSSPYSAPVVLVRKKNNQWRMCIDYRQLNAKSVTDAYPLPRIHHILDRLRNARFISSLDLKDGYWQIAMEPESRKYTAFTVPGRGLFQWKVMPFGLHSAPATFQRALDEVIGIDLEPHVFAYLDDIIVHNATLEDHVSTLQEVFKRLREANLRINPEKCDFFKRRTKYLGHVISAEGIHTDPDKVEAIKALEAPNNVRELRRCLGIASWYRRFVPDFSTLARPMTDLLKKGKHFKWGPEQQTAFDQLKTCLTQAPVLACPDFSKIFKLQTDASEVGLGAVLTQDIEGHERVIAYASRHLNNAEKNYSATERECLAIVWAIRKLREYLEGYHFIVVTDHLSLKWLNNIENPTGRVARWALELQQHSFEIHYRKGKFNVVADALSRQPTRLQRMTGNPAEWPYRKLEEIQRNPQAFPEYVIENGNLYRYLHTTSMDDDLTPWKLCVPREDRHIVLQEAHDQTTAGHQGIRKTIKRITGRYFWPGMFRDISRYVRACQVCQRFKVSQQQPAGLMLTHLPDEPWATVCADFVGPLPRSKHGHTVLLVMQDKFTKWIELVPLRSATSEGAIKGIRYNILARFGAPKMVITDNGTQFTSGAFKRAMQNWGIQHQLTAPYTPQENAVERANRVVKTMIAQFCEHDQRVWDDALPEIMLALNTGVSETTGFSPAYLVQGREPRLPQALFDLRTPGTGTQPEAAEDSVSRLRDTFDLVQQQLQVASQSQARHYNLRHRDWRPAVGQLVWVKEHPLSRGVDGFAAKLAPKYSGPYEIRSFKSRVIVTVRCTASGQQRTAHIRDLKQFYAHSEEEVPDTH